MDSQRTTFPLSSIVIPNREVLAADAALQALPANRFPAEARRAVIHNAGRIATRAGELREELQQLVRAHAKRDDKNAIVYADQPKAPEKGERPQQQEDREVIFQNEKEYLRQRTELLEETSVLPLRLLPAAMLEELPGSASLIASLFVMTVEEQDERRAIAALAGDGAAANGAADVAEVDVAPARPKKK